MDSILYSTLHRRPRVCKNRAIEYKKGRFLNVIFESSNFATLNPSEDTATKRPCRVYYTYMRKCIREDAAHMSLYNTRLAWAG